MQSHHHKSTDKNNTVNKVGNIKLYTITNCNTLYHTYQLLLIKPHWDNIQSHHHKSTEKNNAVNKVRNIELVTIINCNKLPYRLYISQV